MNEQRDNDERYKLILSIKELDQDKLNLLGLVMSSKEYTSIDAEHGKDGESML